MNFKKDLAIVGGLFLLIVGLLFFGSTFTSVGLLFDPNSPQNSGEATSSSQISESNSSIEYVEIIANNFKINAYIADTDKKKKQGLSKRESMAISDGVLFTYNQSAIYTFWMKDVEFAIDIIWIGNDKKIVDIAHDGRISLSLKALKEDPWQGFEKKYAQGTRVKGVIAKINSYGALVKLEDGIQRLVHISEFASEEEMKANLQEDKNSDQSQ